MRTSAFIATALVASLAACSSLYGSDSSPTTKTSYVGTSSMGPTEVGQLLRNNGYSHISNLHKNGADWIGSAVNQSGKPVAFDVDQNGVVHTK